MSEENDPHNESSITSAKSRSQRIKEYRRQVKIEAYRHEREVDKARRKAENLNIKHSSKNQLSDTVNDLLLALDHLPISALPTQLNERLPGFSFDLAFSESMIESGPVVTQEGDTVAPTIRNFFERVQKRYPDVNDAIAAYRQKDSILWVREWIGTVYHFVDDTSRETIALHIAEQALYTTQEVFPMSDDDAAGRVSYLQPSGLKLDRPTFAGERRRVLLGID